MANRSEIVGDTPTQPTTVRELRLPSNSRQAGCHCHGMRQQSHEPRHDSETRTHHDIRPWCRITTADRLTSHLRN